VGVPGGKLSLHILHWTSHGVFWTCLVGKSSEIRPQFLLYKYDAQTSRYENFQRAEFERFGNSELKTSPLYHRWLELLQGYSTCDFMAMADRLPALPGLAGNFLVDLEDEYVAGLWRKSLHVGFLWTPRKQPGQSSGDTEVVVWRLSIAPPWSCISVPPEIGIR
jgi:hypothetical protein